jgi:hypothetical protein
VIVDQFEQLTVEEVWHFVVVLVQYSTVIALADGCHKPHFYCRLQYTIRLIGRTFRRCFLASDRLGEVEADNEQPR